MPRTRPPRRSTQASGPEHEIMAARILVVDVGTSSVRASIVDTDGRIERDASRETLPTSPADGLVEFDATNIAAVAIDLARTVAGDVTLDGVAICNQRASAVVWERATGTPIGPGIGWQDLRTIGHCFAAREHGLRVAPNQTATKLQWLIDTFDPNRERDLLAGTVDAWIAWNLSRGTHHITDATNAAVTGLALPTIDDWDAHALDALGIHATLPTIVDSAGELGTAHALEGAPPIVAMVGDQQSSLVGQACVVAGQAKITFGTGGMLDQVVGPDPITRDRRSPNGTFPIVAWRVGGEVVWGLESIMLAAGTNVQWLRDGLGLIDEAAASHELAASCNDTGGVVFVPAMMGLGTPQWDYGARSGFFGLTRGTSRAQMVRAVLEGVAHRGADLVDAAEADSGVHIGELRIDGGMSDNPTFVQALANATGRPVEIAAQREATTLGAGLLGGFATGAFADFADIGTTWRPRARVEPTEPLDRDRWREASHRAGGWITALSGVDL